MSFDLRSSLAQQAEKFLHDDSYTSSNSSFELEKSLSPARSLSKSFNRPSQVSPLRKARARDTHATHRTNQSTISQRTTRRAAQTPKERRFDFSRSKSMGRKTETTKKTLADLNEQLANPVSCRQEKFLLRTKIEELEQMIKKQDSNMASMYEKVLTKREEVRDLTDQLMESRRECHLVLRLKEKVQELETNELSLVQELQEQKRIAQDSRQKIEEFQDALNNETRRTKKKLQEYYKDKLEEEQISWEIKFKKLEDENWNLNRRVKELETGEEIERKRNEITFNNDLGALTEDLKEKEFELVKSRKELQEFREKFEENERASKLEIKSLKRTIEVLEQQNRNLKANEEDLANKELRERQKIKKRAKQLQEELDQKERQLRERDLEDKDHLEKMNRKISSLQTELKKLRDYEEKIEKLEKALGMKEEELELAKSYYNKKLEESLELQEEQKREWSDLYNELVREIKLLKGEIDYLDGDNKVLMSSLGLKNRRNY